MVFVSYGERKMTTADARYPCGTFHVGDKISFANGGKLKYERWPPKFVFDADVSITIGKGIHEETVSILKYIKTSEDRETRLLEAMSALENRVKELEEALLCAPGSAYVETLKTHFTDGAVLQEKAKGENEKIEK